MEDTRRPLATVRNLILVSGQLMLVACASNLSSDDFATSQRLDRARAGITPPLGATTYTLNGERLRQLPGGENSSVTDALIRLPGVSPGPNGAIRVRGQ